MINYSNEFGKLETLFSDFIATRKIDESKLDFLDLIIKKSNSDQIQILNNAYLSLDEQTTLFGALRNIAQTTTVMKERLMLASQTGENPTTVEIANELFPTIQNVSGYIDDFFDKKEIFNLEKLELFSRNLYKKAKKLGFSKTVSSQLQEEGLDTREISGFVDKFTENINSQLELTDELGSIDESTN